MKYRKHIIMCLLLMVFGIYSIAYHPKTKVIVDREKQMAGIEDIIPDANFRACLTEMLQKGSGESSYDELHQEAWTEQYTTDGNPHPGLTEENLSYIKFAKCANKGITNIQGIDRLVNLERLILNDNRIDNITITSNTKLKHLEINSTHFTTLNISDSVANSIEAIHMGSNSIGNGNNFSNESFRTFLARFPNLYDLGLWDNYGLTGELDVTNISHLHGLWIQDTNISSIKGIGNKTNVEYLDVGNSKVKSVDVGNLINMISLVAYGTEGTYNVDFSRFTKLKQLNLAGCNAGTVNVSNSPDLHKLELDYAKVNSLSISSNSHFTYFNVANVAIVSDAMVQQVISQSANTLTHLNVAVTGITNLDVSSLSKLKVLSVGGNKITSLTTNSSQLEELYVTDTNVKTLTINNNPNLKIIDLARNGGISESVIQSLVTRFTNLENFGCAWCNLKSLDLSTNSKLWRIDLVNNQLSSLALPSNGDALKHLQLSVNALTELNLTPYVNLVTLGISSMPYLETLDLSRNVNLKNLDVFNSAFEKKLDLESFTKIENLTVSYDVAKTIDFSKFPNLINANIDLYKRVAVLGDKFTKNEILSLTPEDISITNYKLYNDFSFENAYSGDTVIGNAGDVIPIRINASHVDFDNRELNDNSWFNYVGFYNIVFVTLNSDKYVINEDKGTIDVGGDSDEVILKNLKVNGGDIKIEGNKLIVSNGEAVAREFTLQRVTNPKTGSFAMFFIMFIVIASAISFYYATRVWKGNEI